MPITTSQLFAQAGLRITGTVQWGTPASSRACGVYVVSLSADPTKQVCLPTAPIDRQRAQAWISRVPTIKLDGLEPTVGTLIKRLREFWLPDESILYIGKATPLRKRINAYYSTPLGSKGPHAGGNWLKTLSMLEETFVHYAEVADCEKSEAELLGIFTRAVSPTTLKRIRDPERPFPFANLAYPPRTYKRHGISKSKLP